MIIPFFNNWIFFTLVAIILWGSTNILDKYLLSRLVKEESILFTFSSVIGLLAAFVIFFFSGFHLLPPFPLLIILLAGISYSVAILLYIKAVKQEEISKVIVWWYITPLFTAMFGLLFLGEKLASRNYVGIVLLVLGAFIMEMPTLRVKISSALRLMLVSCIFLSLNYIGIKYGLKSATYGTVFAWMRIGAFLGAVPYMYIKKQILTSSIKKLRITTGILVSLSEIVNMCGILSITVAASFGFITLVNGLSSLQPLFVFILAASLSVLFPNIIKEDVSKKTIRIKLAACLILTVGLIFLA